MNFRTLLLSLALLGVALLSGCAKRSIVGKSLASPLAGIRFTSSDKDGGLNTDIGFVLNGEALSKKAAADLVEEQRKKPNTTVLTMDSQTEDGIPVTMSVIGSQDNTKGYLVIIGPDDAVKVTPEAWNKEGGKEKDR